MEWIWIVLWILLLAYILSFISFRPKTLDQKRKLWYAEKIKKALDSDPKGAIIACDTILENILRDLGNHGTLADGLKRKKKLLKHLELFWKYHKLRNSLVHEIHPPEVGIQDARNFAQAIRDEFLGK